MQGAQVATEVTGLGYGLVGPAEEGEPEVAGVRRAIQRKLAERGERNTAKGAP